MDTKRELAPLCVLFLAVVDHTVPTSKRKSSHLRRADNCDAEPSAPINEEWSLAHLSGEGTSHNTVNQSYWQ